MNKGFIGKTIAGLLLAGTIGLGATAASAQTANPLPTPPSAPTASTGISGSTTNPGVPTPPTAPTPSGAPQTPRPHPRGGPAADVGTQTGAVRRLNDAYRDLGIYLAQVNNGSTPDAANTLFNSAKASYSDALSAYNTNNYTRASYLAETSKHSVGAAKHLVQAARGTATASVPGVTAPPVSSATNTQERAAQELNHAYQNLGQAVALNSSDSKVAAFVTAGKDAYTAALSDYNAQKYDASAERAHAAHDAADAAISAAKAASSTSAS